VADPCLTFVRCTNVQKGYGPPVAGGEAVRDGEVPTIVIVDDAAEVRLLVRTRLRLSHKLAVVAEGATGADAVAAAAEHRPDLMLLDVSMPEMDGLEALPQVLAASPETRVVMYSGFSEQGLAHQALELGASVFLEKSTSLETLADELVAVLGIPRSAQVAPRTTSPEPEEPGEDEYAVLREHLERFREVFDDAAIGMATVTLAGRVVRANGALVALVGRSRDELVGTAYADLAGAAADGVGAALAEILAGRERVVQVEHDVRVGPGTRRVLATLAPVLDSEQRPLYLFLQVQDVTAQRAAEERLRQSEVRFRLLVENVEDYAIFMLDPDGRIASWNPGAQRIKGYTENEIVGRHFRSFYPPEVQASGHPEHELEVALREGHYEEEGWRVRKDGTHFWANVVITAVLDHDGRHVGFAKITRDTTERREMLDALAGANARLQQAAEDQAHFLAVTAHELRTPVGVLAGTAETLRAHWAALGDEDRDELLDGMAVSATRLRRLLTDLLTASRLQSSALELETDEVDVAELVDVAVATVRRIHPDAEIGIEGEPGLRVHGDADRLAQAIDNLVGNALRHGRPPVLVESRRVGDGALEIAVSDAGDGVPEEMRGRLFDPFATGRARGGTGLGLYIVRQLARAHGGEASYRAPADGVPGSGQFVVSLPLAAPNL
jgi:PAS domain S-box-containing protein